MFSSSEDIKSSNLAATNLEQSDVNISNTSNDIISQDDMDTQLDDGWLFQDNVEIFDVNHEEPLNIMQMALQKSIEKEHAMIPDNVVLPCSIDRAEYYYTSSSNTPVVKLICLVNDGTPNVKSIEDLFFLGNDYIENTIDRLNSVLSRFNYHLTTNDVRDVSTITEAINRLHGRQAKIKQYEKNNDKKYWYYQA